MNGVRITLYVNALYSQQTTHKYGIRQTVAVPSSTLFFDCEYLLRVYVVYFQYGYIPIQQFNKKERDYRYSSCSLVTV